MSRSIICLGLMSGTSLDAIDAAACEFDEAGRPLRLLGTAATHYPEALRDELLSLQRRPDTPVTLRDIARLDAAVGDCFAACAESLLHDLQLPTAAVLAIGSHGQTVFHDPTTLATSTQLGDPNRIAARTGVTVVADLRRADMAHGGQGAPLVPAFHAAAFADPARHRVVLNVGGIANITILPREGAVTGFDTGPGNALLDDWIQASRGQHYDADGAWAASGQLDTALLSRCLDDPYFDALPPKSTGRDHFNLEWLQRQRRDAPLDAEDIQRTMLELSVESIARAIERHAPQTQDLYVCGGGARNQAMMEGLRRRLPGIEVATSAALGIDPDWVEAAAFAWLAWQTMHGRSGNLPSVTGARSAAILGGVYRA
ncbi:anhydro-N-acetylmuramic acid kinase [Solimonas marina]|uniref:anhydro-N-acetylmuramic acid kinase n=1 Tax=Solimonas marina TaxID=2714601 RepID=UPI00344BD17F